MNFFLKFFAFLWSLLLWAVLILGLVGLFFTPSSFPKLHPLTYILAFMWVGSQFQIIDLKRNLKKSEELADYMVRLYK